MRPILHRLLLILISALTLACAGAAAAAFEDTIAQRTRACTACHGDQGRAGPDGYYPRLAGKPEAYLFKQLQNFREGRRSYPLMTGLIDTLSDAYLHEMAQYFATLDLPYPAPRPASVAATVLARGQTLATRGDAALGLPACAQCHGSALMGVLPDVPGLLGLPRDYINAQVGAWQTGQRRAAAPDCMAQVAKKLSPADVNAVAAWLSAQTVPRYTKAATTAASTPVQNFNHMDCKAPAVAPTVTPSPVLTRGAYLARLGNCAACHTVRGGDAYAGGRAIETPFGTVFSSNITPNTAQGIGRWTAQDFWNALHNGESKDGHLLYPAFPYTSYTRVTREDSDAIFGYLQTVPASAQPNRPHALRWPYSTQTALVVWRALSFSPAANPAAPVPGRAPDEDSMRRRGAYLVQGLGHCEQCHSPRNFLGAIKDLGALSGGTLAADQWYAPSLLDVNEASVSHWSREQIAALLKTGTAQNVQVSGPMAEVVLHSTQYLSQEDAEAIAMYLKTLPTSGTAFVPLAPKSPTARVPAKGGALYETHCAECHGKTGQGQAGAYPALANNRAVNRPDVGNLVQIVLHGGFAPSTQGNPRPFGMPPFMLKLSDQDLAALLSHIRTSWGNTGAPVSEFDINKVRKPQQP